MARRCVLSMVLSVDGYINGPGGEFIPPAWSSDLDAWTDEMPHRYDTLLYGRSAWVEMAAYWPRAEVDPATPAPARELARFMNSARKIVFSRTLTDARAWANSEVADADVATVVERERVRAGKNMPSLQEPGLPKLLWRPALWTRFPSSLCPNSSAMALACSKGTACAAG